MNDSFHTQKKNLTRPSPKLSYATLDEAINAFNTYSDKHTDYTSETAKKFLEACRAGSWPQNVVKTAHQEYLAELRKHFDVCVKFRCER